MVIGEGDLPDKAVDEEVEMVFGEPENVEIETETDENNSGNRRSHTVTISNANPFPIRYEIDFVSNADFTFSSLPGSLIKKPGKRVWATTIPANSKASLRYATVQAD
jgi:hypothetical protein